MVPGSEGGVTKYYGKPDVAAAVSGGRSPNPAASTAPATSGEQMSIYDAAMKYQKENVPLVILAGHEYGTGSSRDWAAKGTRLLGVKAVIAASFERIHRSNLVGMGVLPLQFPEGTNAQTLSLDGSETFSITGLSDSIEPGKTVTLDIERKNGERDSVPVRLRIDTPIEIDYYRHGGILQFVLRQLLATK
jgi:aconitate hydratase